MDIDFQKLYSIIIKARLAKGYTQTNLAYMLGISQKNYLYLESGRCKLDISKFLKIADSLEINPLEIINSVTSNTKWPINLESYNEIKIENEKLLEQLKLLQSHNDFLQDTIKRLLAREKE